MDIIKKIDEAIEKNKSENYSNEKVISLLSEAKEALEISLRHNEYLEPLFERFKSKTLGRLELLNLPKETKEYLKFNIDNSQYTDKVFELMINIENKTKDFFKEKEKVTLTKENKSDLYKNLSLYKSGK